jgi:soluble lytic murein transglycosylase-like protein
MTQIRAMIAQSAGRYGVDPALVRAIAWQESGWWQGARSSAGALGVMQLMPDTATWVGSALVGRRLDPTNARDNIDGGTAYVAWLMRQTTNRNQAVAAYYQGLGSVQRRGMYADTREYVRSVNSHYGVR